MRRRTIQYNGGGEGTKEQEIVETVREEKIKKDTEEKAN